MSKKRQFNPARALEKVDLKYNIAERLDEFETPEEARARDEKLVKRVENRLGLRGTGLVDQLTKCTADRRRNAELCLSPACSRCGRIFRQWLFDQAYKQREHAKEALGHRGVSVTLIAADLIASPEKLYEIDLKAAKTLWWKGIHKVGLTHPIIGGIDISFNEEGSSSVPGHYQVHFTFVALGHPSSKSKRDVLKRQIKAAFELEPGARRPVRVTPLRSPVDQLSYIYKTLFSRRVSYTDNDGTRDALDHPLKGAQAVEIAAWLDRFEMLDRLLLHGLRRRGHEIVSTAKNDCEN